MKLLYRWIYKGDGNYQEAVDYRTSSVLPGGGTTAVTASSVSFTPTGNVAATDVQSAIAEVDSEKVAISGPLGTPSSGTLTNCTGLPVAGITASTSTALGVGSIELGHASDTTIARVSAGVISVEGATVLVSGGALGTPSSGTLSSCSGLPVSGITSSTSTALGLGSIELGHASDTTIARVSAGVVSIEGANIIVSGGALGTPSSGTLTSCTGLPVSGITSSTSTALGLGSIELGHASDTTIARVSAGVISVEGVTIPSISSTNTLTNKRITRRTGTTASTSSLTIDADSYDRYTVTALAADITVNQPSGTPVDGDQLRLRIKTSGGARAISRNAVFRAIGITLPSSIASGKTFYELYEYNSADSKWDVLATGTEA
jgi:hypothetical protein